MECHEHFSTHSAADLHQRSLVDGGCLPPGTVTHGNRSAKAGQPKLDRREDVHGVTWTHAGEYQHG